MVAVDMSLSRPVRLRMARLHGAAAQMPRRALMVGRCRKRTAQPRTVHRRGKQTERRQSPGGRPKQTEWRLFRGGWPKQTERPQFAGGRPELMDLRRIVRGGHQQIGAQHSRVTGTSRRAKPWDQLQLRSRDKHLANPRQPTGDPGRLSHGWRRFRASRLLYVLVRALLWLVWRIVSLRLMTS